ncbi:MAG: SGNH/GDSL hydrolase family protein [Rhodospirillales bacterium]|nr:SGNH/GDSL hydrolase family protein [Rhodospirillales bacterium]
MGSVRASLFTAASRSLLTNLALAVGALLASDVAIAQVGLWLVDSWREERLERIARVDHPVYEHGLKPMAAFGHRFGGVRAPYFTNSLGFRDRAAREVPLRSERPRLLFMGDSFTEGIGIAFEDTFAGRIQERLGQEGVDVLNGALESYAPSIYYRKVRFYIEEIGLQANAVVVFLDLSDIDDDLSQYKLDENDNVRTVVDRHRWLKRFKFFLKDHSVLYRLYRLARDSMPEVRRRQKGRIDAVTNWTRGRWTIDDALFETMGRPGLRIAAKHMDKLHAFLQQRGIPLTVVVYPWPDQVLAGDMESRHVCFWRAWAAERSVGFIDLFPAFIAGRDPVSTILDYFIPYDVHFNEKGHALVAEAFLKTFGKDWIAKPIPPEGRWSCPDG